MSTNKKMTDPSVPRVTAIPDDALVTVFDKTSGAASTIEFSKLREILYSGIQVGGRNLLSSVIASASATFSKSGNTLTLVTNADAYARFKFACPVSELEFGKDHIFSFWAEGMQENDKWSMQGRNNGCFKIEVKNGFNFARFVLEEDDVLTGNLFMIDDGVRSFPNGFHNVKLSQFKMERGTIPTGYSIAPEEISEIFGGG